MADPLVVEVTRGALVESRHEVDAVVVAAGATTTWGDGDRRVHPRSAVKMVQALPLVESGAADAVDLSSVELALACASHKGEPRHIAAVRAWLQRLGLDERQFECGVQSGRPDGPIANNCSGKHAGFLTLCRHLAIDPAGYVQPDHPMQRLVTAALEQVFAVELDSRSAGIDGCGIPAHAIPLRALAMGTASFATPPAAWTAGLVRAGRRLGAAMRAEPFMVAGTGRLCTNLMEDVDGLIAKTGAEGVYVVAAIDRSWAAAVKARDGATRAAEIAVLELVERAGHRLSDRLAARRRLTNWSGVAVGEMRVADG